jgi:hypothetical protein
MIKKIIRLVTFLPSFSTTISLAQKTTFEGNSKDLKQALTWIKENPTKYQVAFINARSEELLIDPEDIDFKKTQFSKIILVKILNTNPENAECSKTFFYKKKMGGWHIEQFYNAEDEHEKKCVIL